MNNMDMFNDATKKDIEKRTDDVMFNDMMEYTAIYAKSFKMLAAQNCLRRGVKALFGLSKSEEPGQALRSIIETSSQEWMDRLVIVMRAITCSVEALEADPSLIVESMRHLNRYHNMPKL